MEVCKKMLDGAKSLRRAVRMYIYRGNQLGSVEEIEEEEEGEGEEKVEKRFDFKH